LRSLSGAAAARQQTTSFFCARDYFAPALTATPLVPAQSCAPDAHLIFFAFVCLTAAAVAQVAIPKYTGDILDAINTKLVPGQSVWKVEGFSSNVIKLSVAAVALGFFSGLRGSTFTVVGGRVNARLRIQLMNALLAQDIGFFDITKTGDITSRLCSDTTLVGDQVTLNVNVFLRSFVQAIGVLLFMFTINVQLTLVAFVSVPAITLMSKVYGVYVRERSANTAPEYERAEQVPSALPGAFVPVSVLAG
jgi:ATP-binding cassette, subfamily B (MDR/TAP), member 9